MATFSRRFLRGSILPATALATALYATSSPILADEGSSQSVRPGRTSTGDKLPIYPTPQGPPITLIETPHPLSPYIGEAREKVTGVLGETRGYVQDGVSRWVKFERNVEGEVKTILPEDESLTPGILYVLISGLTGSVLTRSRMLPLRILTPPLFTLIAFPYFLPKTAHNTSTYLLAKEHQYLPEFAERQERFTSTFSSHLGMTLDRIKGLGEEAQEVTVKAVERVESATGLRVGDAVRRGQEKVGHEKEKMERFVETAKTRPVERVGYVVEQKPVAEIVRPVEEIKPAQPEGKRLV